MDLKNVLVSAGVALLVAVLGFAYFGPTEKVIERTIEKIGAFPGPEIDSPFISVNGLRSHYYDSPFLVSSSTLCSFRAPVNSTTTLAFASAQINTASTAALFFEWGRGTTYTSTTTSLGVVSLAARLRATIIASTTGTVTDAPEDDSIVIPPGQYINFVYGISPCVDGSVCTTLAGRCKVQLREN